MCLMAAIVLGHLWDLANISMLQGHAAVLRDDQEEC